MSLIDDLRTGSGKPEKVDASPKMRDIFFGYTHSGYQFIDALAEYIDNSFQQGLKQKDPSAVRIDVSAKSDGPTHYIEIVDNAGGAKRVDAVNFIRPGASGNDSSSDTFGLFGIGGKVAGLSTVTESVIIISKSFEDPGFWVQLKKSDIETRPDWQFDVMPFPKNSGISDGQTKVILYGVPSEVSVKLTNHYLADYARRYAFLLLKNNGKGPKIYLNGMEVKPYDPTEDMLNAKEAPKGCEPKTYSENKRLSVMDKEHRNKVMEIQLKVTIGLRPAGSTIGESGAAIYCNDRLIERHSQLALYELFDSKDSAVHPGSDKAWIHAVVRMNGPGSLMPWTSRKDSLDSSSKSYPALNDFLKRAYEDFLDNHIGPAREALRSNHEYGKKKLYISDILVDSYARKLKGGDLHQETVRPIIQNSQSFGKAIGKAKGKIVTEPPVNKDIINLSGSIEREKVEIAKRLVKAENGKDDITNTELVRYMVEHIIMCLGGEASDEADKIIN
ncbi:MAG: ATP-binding protein [Thermoplasmataceae archaeon]